MLIIGLSIFPKSEALEPAPLLEEVDFYIHVGHNPAELWYRMEGVYHPVLPITTPLNSERSYVAIGKVSLDGSWVPFTNPAMVVSELPCCDRWKAAVTEQPTHVGAPWSHLKKAPDGSWTAQHRITDHLVLEGIVFCPWCGASRP